MSSKSRVPDEVKKVRDDLSNWVWHFARRENPLEDLRSILRSGFVKGSPDRITGTTVVCLTEAPLVQFAKQSPVLDSLGYERLSDYGVGFRKAWLFAQGGLPVIYQPRTLLRDDLPMEYRFRHVDLNLSNGVDYSWQREWRVCADRLQFTNKEAVVVLRTVGEGDGLVFDIEPDGDFEDGEPVNFATIIPRWSYVSHDQFKNIANLTDNMFERALRDSDAD